MKAVAEEVVPLTNRKIRSIIGSPEKCALAVNLIYVRDNDEGIRRMRRGKQFFYLDRGANVVKDKVVVARINSLGIPPAWENVWICSLDNGHLQATGYDAMQRKQYLYHSLWHSLRTQTKFYRLLQFGQVIPGIRTRVEKDLALLGLPVEKVLALVVSLMELTNMRVGNSMYEKLYGSYGMTTLKDQHVQISGSQLKFSFRGKKGVYHDISIKNKRLAKLVQACRDIPGKELFQYFTPEGDRKSIDSGMVNAYIKEITGEEFTAKDFRTWSGTILAFLALKEIGSFEKATEAKKKIVEVLDIVSQHLGNTRNVCKKYYVHPVLLSMYENKALEKYFPVVHKDRTNNNAMILSPDEQTVLKILEAN